MAKSKAKAAAAVLAAAATTSSSAAAAPPPASLTSSVARAAAAGSLDLPHRESLADGIPRGGHAPPASAEAAEEEGAAKAAMREGAKRRKKKKRSKQRAKSAVKEPQQSDATNDDAAATTDAPSGDAPPSEGNEGSSSTSPLPPAAQSILAQTCHYDVLGITKAATQAEIQKAYRRRCVLTHPDKLPNGDRSAFDKVSAAYDVLGCEKKRAVYDKFGHAGIEGDIDLDNLSRNGGFGGGFGGFGNDVFRDFFGAGTEQFFGRRSASPQPHPFRRAPPRNRDLRYQLEVSLEELYSGATKRVAIQQPNPARPQYPLRKEVEVALTPGMAGGQSVRLSGVVDSVPDAAPADVVFLIRERRHRIFTRRGADLAVEVTISFAESIVGFKRTVLCLDGRELVIGSPSERTVVRREEAVEAPSLPIDHDAEGMAVETNATIAANATVAEAAAPEQITKTTTLSYHLPPSIIQTGDVHVLRGRGMPKRGGASAHRNDQFGDLYVQYVVETPGASSEAGANADNLSPEERVELARLLSKLEGSEDPTVDVIETGEGDEECENTEEKEAVHQLSVSSAAEFGRSSVADNDHDEHLRHDEDDAGSGMPHGANDFFRQAFGGRSAGGFGGHFGLGGTGGGFGYFSSGGGGASEGFGYGQQGAGEEEDHTVQCNQM